MSESQVELDNCRACDEDVARHDGNCAICGLQVFDPAKIRQVLDQINQGEL